MSDIFLSASVPNAESEFAATSDSQMIHAAVRALCLTALRTHRIVWGGHPAITPMIWAVCENMGESYRERVILYQTNFFSKGSRPVENDGFSETRITEARADLASSLKLMRETMFNEHKFSFGIFIGGKQGILDEFEMFRELQPRARAIVLPSTGGASLLLSDKYPELSAPRGDFTDFVGFLAPILDAETPSRSAAPVVVKRG